MATILVTGVGGPAGKNIAELLLERKHDVIGTDIITISQVNIKFYCIPAAREVYFCKELHQIAQRERVTLLIPTVSEELPILAADKDNWGKIPIVVTSLLAVSIANDKYLTYQSLSKLNIPVPRSVLPSQVNTSQDVERMIGWPCLSKPRIGRGGRNVKIYQEVNWPEITQLDDAFVLQEFISGTEYCPNIYATCNGKMVITVLEKLELKGGIIGNAKKVHLVEEPDVAHLAISAVKALGLTGPLDIDIRRRNDGTPVILEINARFGAHVKQVPEILEAALREFQIH
jgi:carbamoylphosphate synthase large subunit